MDVHTFSSAHSARRSLPKSFMTEKRKSEDEEEATGAALGASVSHVDLSCLAQLQYDEKQSGGARLCVCVCVCVC